MGRSSAGQYTADGRNEAFASQNSFLALRKLALRKEDCPRTLRVEKGYASLGIAFSILNLRGTRSPEAKADCS